MEYVAAWANLRAGNDQRVLELLASEFQSHGPSSDMTHSLRAIALNRLGKDDKASDELNRASNALDRLIRESVESTNDQRPWIDFVEMVLLHREATLAVTGKEIGLDPRIKEAQWKMRETLAF